MAAILAQEMSHGALTASFRQMSFILRLHTFLIGLKGSKYQRPQIDHKPL